MANGSQLQDKFLEVLVKQEVPVSVFLVNGIKLHGTISEYDETVLKLKNSSTQIVFKTAISTIVPNEKI